VKIIVVDASVAAKWFFSEIHSRAALEVLRPGNRLYAPDFLLLEMDSVFSKRVQRGDITEREARDARAMLRQMPVEYHPFGSLLDGAFEIAARSGCSMYDALYAALARSLGGAVVTADRKFYDSFSRLKLGRHLTWVEDI
jgi:predicted nucleic acid-binding protein